MFPTTHRIGLVALIAAIVALPATALAGVRDGRSPDTKDAAVAAHAPKVGYGFGQSGFAGRATQPPRVVDGRSPDTRDAALAAHSTPKVLVAGSGFDWTDAGIGAAGGFGIAVIAVGAVGLVTRRAGGKLAV